MRIKIFLDRYTNLASLPLNGFVFRYVGMKAHATMHQSIMQSQARPLTRGGAIYV